MNNISKRNVKVFQSTRRNSGLGFTLMELLVAVSVLVVLMLSFGEILATSQESVSKAQGVMRRNTMAMAIDTTLRNDFRKFCKIGSMHLKNNVITFVTSGPSESLTSTLGEGVGTITSIGTCADTTRQPYNVIFHCRRILAWKSTTATDCINADLSKVQYSSISGSNQGANAIANTLKDQIPNPSSLSTLPSSLAEIENCWKILGLHIKSLSIEVSLPNSSSWENSGDWSRKGSYNRPTQVDWPSLVRFRYTVSDPKLPAGQQDMQYETIIPLN